MMELDELQERLAIYYESIDPDISPGPLTVLNGGWASGVYTFTLHSSEVSKLDTKPLVLKTYQPNRYGRQNAMREWHALTRLPPVGFAVPRGVSVELDERHLGSTFIVMEYVEGKMLWDLLEGADSDTERSLTQVFVERFVALHALDPHILEPALDLGQPYAFIERELAYIRQCSETSRHTTLAAVVTWLEQRKHTVPCNSPVILHRDYHPWNVLQHVAGQTWVIDWDWEIGDLRFDVAWTVTLMRRSGFERWSTAVLEEYKRQSNRLLDEFSYFEVLTTVRWLYNVTQSLDSEDGLQGDVRAAFQTFLVEPVAHTEIFLHDCTGIDVHIEL